MEAWKHEGLEAHAQSGIYKPMGATGMSNAPQAPQGETAQLLALWRRSQARGEQVCLATVVHVEGSSYRKAGARMLLSSGGERAGTVSGGCLEAEVARKAWWLTANGPALECYQSSLNEDGDDESNGVPWGLGCGGTVWVLLERDPTPVLEAVERALAVGEPAVIVTGLELGQGSTPGTLAIVRAQAGSLESGQRTLQPSLARAAAIAGEEHRSLKLDIDFAETMPASGKAPTYVVEYLPAPPRLTIFGAGDDAQPVARFAEALGWRVAVADGRSNLLRRERFPDAAELRQLLFADGDSPLVCGLNASAHASRLDRAAGIPFVETGVRAGELAVLLTHSYEQDRALLGALLPLELKYLGILGPRHRTLRLLGNVAPVLGWTIEQCLQRLHTPVGLDLGARDPASIALAIVAELQATLAGRHIKLARTKPPAIAPLTRHGSVG